MDFSYLRSLATSNDGFVFDPCTGHSFNTNPTGLYMLRRLQQGTSLDELTTQLRDELDAPRESVEDDIQRFVSTLREFGWIRSANPGRESL